MILQTPKKLLSAAKAFSPVWLTNLSPARLFTTNPTLDESNESMILDPPTWPENVARDEFWENGAPIHPQRRLKRCYGPNGSFHRSIHLRQLEANRAYNAYQKKRSRYEAQQARQKRLQELDRPVPLADLHSQAVQQLIDSDDPEDRIFLRELASLRNQTDNLEKFAPVAAMLESLENLRAQADYTALSAHKPPHAVPSFSTFKRQRRSNAVQEAAERKRQQAQRAKPSPEEEKREKERKEAERRKKEYDEEQTREREAARVRVEKAREQVYREEIRNALEQGRPPPDHLQHRQDLIQEIAQLVTQAALRRQQEAALRAKLERQQRFAREQEARRRAEEEEARRRAQELEARRRAEELLARRQAKLAEERAAREAEQRRREQEEAQRRHAEEEARRRAAEEEARRQQAQQEQARRAPPSIPSDFFKMYDDKWAALRGAEVFSHITFVQFPWPVLYQISDISGINLDSVRAFFAYRGTKGKAMKAEILKWHPDKLNNQLHQVHPDHREQVKEAGELVAKFLNNIMEN